MSLELTEYLNIVKHSKLHQKYDLLGCYYGITTPLRL